MTEAPESRFPRLRIGVSSCLLGEKVRWDGQHKRNAWVMESLDAYVDWLPVCPEVEIGLGVPRPTIRLEGKEGGVRLMMPSRGEDLTAKMRSYAEERVGRLQEQRLSAYILKKGSPSCGMERVKIWNEHGMPLHNGQGVFAAALLAALPDLPVEEEGRLNDRPLRENFVTRAFAYQRWLDLEDRGMTRARLMKFHEHHKFVLMARNQTGMRRLGRLLGQSARAGNLKKLAAAYLADFTLVMKRRPTTKSHTNVLQHLAGFVSDFLDAPDRAELTEMIDQYRRGLLPLVVPVTMLRHYGRKFAIPYFRDQVYLEPHPHELMLLNHV